MDREDLEQNGHAANWTETRKRLLAWLRIEVLAIVGFIALVIARIAFPNFQLHHIPAILLGFSGVLLFPGLILSGMLPELSGRDWIKRLPLAFVLSYAFWALPSYILMRMHSTWPAFNTVFIVMNSFLILGYCAWLWRSSHDPIEADPNTTREDVSDKQSALRQTITHQPGTILLVLMLLVALAAVVPLSVNGYLDGDVLVNVAFLRSVAQDQPFTQKEPLFGTDLEMPTRGVANPWLLLPAFISRQTGIDPLPLVNDYLPAFLAVLAVMSVYLLVHEFSNNHALALFSAILFVIYLAAEPFHRHGNASYMLFRRVISDKHFLLLIFVPAGLAMGHRFLITAKLRFLLLAGFIGLGITTTHAMITLFYLISTSAFSGVFALLSFFQRKPDQVESPGDSIQSKFGRFKIPLRAAALVTVVLVLMAIPLIQQRAQSDSSGYLFVRDFSKIPLAKNYTLLTPYTAVPSYYVPGGRIPYLGDIPTDGINPYIIRRLYGQIKASGLVILSKNRYISNPDLLWDWGPLLALALTPFLLIWAKRDHLALYLLVIMLVYPAINFNPYLAPIVGRFITPWLLYRFTWPLPVTIVLAYFLFKLFVGLGLGFRTLAGQGFFSRISRPVVNLLPAGALIAAAVFLWPKIQVFTHELLFQPNRLRAMSPGLRLYIHDHLDNGQPSIILSDYETNQFITALFDKPDIIAHRYNTTSEEFPSNQQKEALQRSLDIDQFTKARLFTQDTAGIIQKYQVNYVLLRNDRPMACQFPYLSDYFQELYHDDIYTLYQVKSTQFEAAAITGNTLLANNNWEQAKMVFETTIPAEPSSVLDRLGLAEALTRLGHPDQALAQYQHAQDSHPNEICIMKQLAQGYLEVGNLDEAVSTYQNALAISPSHVGLLESLGDVYLLQGRTSEAQSTYLKAIAIQASIDPQAIGSSVSIPDFGNTQVSPFDDDSLMESAPQGSSYSDLTAKLFQKKGWYDAALSTVQQTLSHPGISLDYLLITNTAISSGKPDLAIDLLMQALARNPTDSHAYYYLGVLYQYQEKYPDALTAYQASVRMSLLKLDWNWEARLRIGSVYRAMGKLDLAVQQFQEVAQYIPYLADPYLEIARIHQEIGDVSGAMQAYDQATLANPLDSRPYVQRGSYYDKHDQNPSALAQYQAAIQVKPDSFSAWNSLGRFYLEQGNFELSRQAFWKSIALVSTNSGAYLGLANLDTKTGNKDGALANSQLAIISEPSSALPYLALGEAYVAKSEFASATIAYQHAIQVNPQKVAAYIRLGDIDQQQGRDEDALAKYQTAVEAVPTSGEALLALGNAYLSSGRRDEAAALYDRAIQTDPTLVGAYISRARLYMSQSNDGEAAAALYIRAAKTNPTVSEPYQGLGNFYVHQGFYDDAALAYQEAISITPNETSSYVNLSDLQRLQGEWELAISTLDRAIQINPAAADAHLHLASIYLQRAAFNKARSQYDRVLQADPSNVAGYSGKILLILHEQDKDFDTRVAEARALLSDAVAKNPASAMVYILQAEFEETQGNYTQAEIGIQKGVGLEPKNPLVYTHQGQFYYRHHRYAEAISSFEQGLSISTDKAGFYIDLANCAAAMGKHSEALDWFAKAAAYDRSNPSSWQGLANYYIDLRDYPSAIQALETATKAIPADATLHQTLGSLYQMEERYKDAQTQFEIANAYDQSQPIYSISLGKLYHAIQQWDQSLAAFEQAIAISPGDTTGYTSLGQEYQYLGKQQAAEQSYTQGIAQSLDKANALLSRAGYYKSQASWDLAEKDYTAALQSQPRSQTIGSQIANFYINRGKLDLALSILIPLSGLPDANASIYVNLGYIYSTQANWIEAITSYQQAIDKDGTSVEGYIGLAKIYTLLDRGTEVLDIYQDAVKAAPNNPLTYSAMGDYYLSRLDYRKAEESYHQALAYDPYNLSVLFKLDQVHQGVGEEGVMLDKLEAQAKVSPNISHYLALGSIYELRGEWQTAMYWYYQAVHLDPNNGFAWLALGNYFRNIRDWEHAADALQKAVQLQPGSPDAWLALGAVQESSGLSEKALESYSRAIASDYTQITGYIALSALQVKEEHVEDGLRILQKGLAAMPSSIDAYGALADIYASQGNFDQAIEILQSGITRMPGAADFYIHWGDVLVTEFEKYQTDLFRAQAYVKKTQYDLLKFEDRPRLIERNGEAYDAALGAVKRAQVLLNLAQNEYDQFLPEVGVARSKYLEALRLQPGNLAALIGQGHIAEDMVDFEAALAYYQEAVMKHPESPQAYELLGSIYLKLNQPEEATASFRKALQISPENPGANSGILQAIGTQSLYTTDIAAQNLRSSQYDWDNWIARLRHTLGVQ